MSLIRVRGSGEAQSTGAMLNSPGKEGDSGFQSTLDAASMAFRQRAAAAQWRVNEIDLEYPALEVGQIPKDVVGLIRSSGQAKPKYLQSIEAGRKELRRVLGQAFACSTRKIALMGYSQGAYVVGDVLAELPDTQASRINAAILFGDPRFDPRDPTARGDFNPKQHGIAVPLFGMRSIGGRYSSRVHNYCVKGDLVCQGPDPTFTLYAIGTQSLALATAMLVAQTNAHTHGYPCEYIATNVACRVHLENRQNSVSKTAGEFLANTLGIPKTPPAVAALEPTVLAGSALAPSSAGLVTSVTSQIAKPGSPEVLATPALPTADPGGPYTFTVGVPALFSGANSSDSTLEITQWEWDLNNDGTFEFSSDSPTFEHTFNAVGSGVAALRVTNSAGASSTATVAYDVAAPTVNLSVSVTGLAVSPPTDGPLVSWDAYPANGGVQYIVRDQTGAILDSVVGLQFDLSARPDVTAVSVSALTVEGETVQTAPLAVAHAATFNSMTPTRLLDTRQGVAFTTFDHNAEGAGVVPAGTEIQLTVTGRAGVPANAAGVVLNVTVTQPSALGYVTVYPCGTTRPIVSNLNFSMGQTVANLVVAHTGAGGQVCFYTSAATHLIADINGFYGAGAQYVAVAPARVLETRNSAGSGTIDALAFGHGRLMPGEVLPLQLAGRAGVPFEAGAVMLNLTVTGSDTGGYVTVYPCDVERPTASNLNFGARQTIANAVVAQTDVSGQICVYASSATHVIVDVNGYYPAGPALTPIPPARLMDTRGGATHTTADGAFAGMGALGAGQEVALQVTGRVGVNSGASAAMLSVIVTGTQGRGFLTVYPCGVPRPLASNLNFDTGQTVAGAVIAKVGVSGQVCFYSNQTTHLIVDLNAYHAYP